MHNLLSVLTRNGSSPNGKPRVFVAYHPEDKELVQDVVQDVFSCQNCAIFYRENYQKNVDENEIEFELKQMSLIIIPVTANFLKCDSAAYNVEFKFARENNIPVLPLMYGKGLERTFNAACGDLQFLDKFAKDSTAIDYKKKLKDFLNSVLIDDTLLEKIRSSFDAYIFLSYRKKDRMYANEFMKRVHSKKELRDVAIWYDEFLSPGENFNEEIKEALNKSEIFALLVTPNLVNEVNYVMTHEYPMALENNKKVLPAEVVKTDKKELEKSYKNLPEIIDANNDKLLAENLTKNLKRLLSNKPETPEHLYYIGLAYLAGIDVEQDTKKAVTLLEESSEHGFPPASEKLANMYSLGDRVEYNVEKAVYYREKAVKINEEIFNELKNVVGVTNDTAVYTLVKEYYELAEMYRNARKLDEAEQACNKALEYYSYFLKESKEVFEDVCVSINNTLAGIYTHKREFEKVEKIYQDVCEIRRKRAEETGSVFSYANSLMNFGHFYSIIGEHKKSLKCTLKAKEVFDKVKDEYLESDSNLYATIIDNLASAYTNLGEHEKSVSLSLEALEIYKKLAKKFGMYEYDLAICYDNVGENYKKNGDFKNSEKYTLLGLEVWKKLIKTSTNAYVYDYLLCINNLTLFYYEQKDYKKSIKIMEEAIAFCENNEIAETVANSIQLSTLYWFYALVCDAVKKYDKTKECFDKCFKHLKHMFLHEQDRYVDTLINYANCFIACFDHAGDIDSKERVYKEFIDLLKEVVKYNDDYKTQLAEVYNHLAEHYQNTNKLVERRECLRQIVILYDELKRSGKKYDGIEKAMASFAYQIAKTTQSLGNEYIDQAIDEYEYAIYLAGQAEEAEKAEGVAEEEKEEKMVFKILSNSGFSLGLIYQAKENYQDAVQAYQVACYAESKSYELETDNDALYRLAQNLVNMADCYMALGDYNEVREKLSDAYVKYFMICTENYKAYTQKFFELINRIWMVEGFFHIDDIAYLFDNVLEMYEDYVKIDDSPELKNVCGNIAYFYASILEKRGMKREAINQYEKVVSIFNNLKKQTGQEIQNLLTFYLKLISFYEEIGDKKNAERILKLAEEIGYKK